MDGLNATILGIKLSLLRLSPHPPLPLYCLIHPHIYSAVPPPTLTLHHPPFSLFISLRSLLLPSLRLASFFFFFHLCWLWLTSCKATKERLFSEKSRWNSKWRCSEGWIYVCCHKVNDRGLIKRDRRGYLNSHNLNEHRHVSEVC